MNPWIITSSTWFTIEYHFTVHCTLLLFCYDKKLLRTPWNCHVHKGHKSWQSGNELVNMEFTFFANCRNVGRVDVSMSRTMGKCNMYHVYSTIFGYFLGILRVRSHRLPCFYWSISPCLYILSITIKIRPLKSKDQNKLCTEKYQFFLFINT